MNMIKASIVKQNNELLMKTNDGIIVPVPKDKQNSVSEGQNISFGFRAEDIVPLKFGQKPDFGPKIDHQFLIIFDQKITTFFLNQKFHFALRFVRWPPIKKRVVTTTHI